jgi:hypothetical protein
MESAFWFVALAMFACGTLHWWLGEEAHARMNPGVRPTEFRHANVVARAMVARD